MAELKRYIEAIEALHKCGLNRSALSLIRKADDEFGDAFRGAAINSLKSAVKREAKFPKIPPGIYALTTFEGLGIVVPLQAEEGSASIKDPEASQAWHTAQEFVLANRKEFLSDRPSSLSIPILKPVLPKPFELEGASFGLPAALAILSRLGDSPRKPVLATGKISEKGMIGSVGHMDEKISSAINELGYTDGVIVVPAYHEYLGPGAESVRPVRNLAEAISAIKEPQTRKQAASVRTEKTRTEKKSLVSTIILVTIIFFIVGFAAGYAILHGFGDGKSESAGPKSEGKELPAVENETYEIEKQEILEAYRGLQIAWETCKRDEYYIYFMDELERYYKKESTPLDFIQESRDKRLGDGCVPEKGHKNAAIQFIETGKERAVITICPSGSWTDGTCVDRNTGEPWKPTKILGYVKHGGRWKISFEFSGKDNPKNPRKYDSYRSYKIDPEAWVTVW